jgi:hypothetical protein
MNEPFVGGIQASVQSSHEANVHKRRVAYDLDIEEEAREANLTIDELKDRMNRELCSKIELDIKTQGHAISAEDVNTILVKNDGAVEYGLKIQERKYQKL